MVRVHCFSFYPLLTSLSPARFHPDALGKERKIIKDRMKASSRFMMLYDRYPHFHPSDPKKENETSVGLWLSTCFKGSLMTLSLNKKSRLHEITQITPVIYVGGLEGAEDQALLFEHGFPD